jgi:hypothetical protein
MTRSDNRTTQKKSLKTGLEAGAETSERANFYPHYSTTENPLYSRDPRGAQ